jgi:16S rRNA (guanine966-N2)-methyltransferase
MPKANNEVRIIGGKWRSRKIKFSGNPYLRPTPNRVRETVFNWLDPVITNAVCLDMFAGSGALGFEALSRGAKSVIMMDKSKQVISDLKKNAVLLSAGDIIFVCKEFSSKLHNFFKQQFDIVFLDPPFHKNLVQSCSQWLEQNDCLTQGAFIYTENESVLKTIDMPSNWKLYRQKTTGQVCYSLWQKI